MIVAQSVRRCIYCGMTNGHQTTAVPSRHCRVGFSFYPLIQAGGGGWPPAPRPVLLEGLVTVAQCWCNSWISWSVSHTQTKRPWSVLTNAQPYSPAAIQATRCSVCSQRVLRISDKDTGAPRSVLPAATTFVSSGLCGQERMEARETRNKQIAFKTVCSCYQNYFNPPRLSRWQVFHLALTTSNHMHL